MQKMAIIGTGISGMSAAYFLNDEYDLTIYEKNAYIGGHSNTIWVEEGEKKLPIDAGFIVFNDQTYPNLIKLFEQLNVQWDWTDMSFSVQHLPSKLEYCGSGLDGLFAQRKNLLNPKHIKMLFDINRFNQMAPKMLESGELEKMSVGDFRHRLDLGDDFYFKYLIPMSSAVWSTPPSLMLEFPIQTLIRFFYNHGFLGLNTQHRWKTVRQGSQAYVKKITKSYRDKILTSSPVSEVFQEGDSFAVIANGEKKLYDKVLFASHADETLKMIRDSTSSENQMLSQFKYQANLAVLHTDTSFMPKVRKTWSAWNYRIASDSQEPSTIYYMNMLQNISTNKDYFVSINPERVIEDQYIIKKIEYTHPLFDLGAVKAQPKITELNKKSRGLYFCGSYFRYGFHEDALLSSKVLCEQLLGRELLT